MDIKWGGSGIEKVVFDYIESVVPKGGSILEFGAGYVSTVALKDNYDLTSVEHNEEYSKINPNTIFCGVKNGFYDLNKKLLKDRYELIIIDGFNRIEFLKHIDILKKGNKILIHDTYRESEIELAKKLAKKLKRKVTFFTDGDYWAVI